MDGQMPSKIQSSSKTQSPPRTPLCCEWLRFHDVDEAKGSSLVGMGRGPIVIANIFLTTSILFLASKEAGCVTEANVLEDNCTKRIYGIKPSSIFTFVALIAGILSAILMPVIGAMVDYTPYRRQVGIYSAVFILIIEMISIFTVQSTWFAMAILQIVCVFTYHMQSLTTYAYLPDIARVVGEDIMTEFTGLFIQLQFMSQLSFLIIVGTIQTFFGIDDVVTAHVSQIACVLLSSVLLFFGWKLLKDRPPNRVLLEGQWLATQGFIEIHHTAKMINKCYRKGVKWYFLALMFAEAGTNAFMVIAVTYLADTLKMKSNEVAFAFFLLFVSVVPGAMIGQYFTKRTNPNTSWKLSMLYFIVITTAAVFVISDQDKQLYVYPWAILWGLYLGWFYPAENLFFSLCLPKGREAEFSGFYTFCTQIIAWLPSLLFTIINENGYHQRWGLLMLNVFFIAAITMLMLVAPWDEVIEEASNKTDIEEGKNKSVDGKISTDKHINGKANDNNKNTVDDIENINSKDSTVEEKEETHKDDMGDCKNSSVEVEYNVR